MLVADDQFICVKVLRKYLQLLNVGHRCEYLNDGLSTINRTIQIVEEVISQSTGQTGTITPVSLMLLDF